MIHMIRGPFDRLTVERNSGGRSVHTQFQIGMYICSYGGKAGDRNKWAERIIIIFNRRERKKGVGGFFD